MKIDKLGWYRAGNGMEVQVDFHDPESAYPWQDRTRGRAYCWTDEGKFLSQGGSHFYNLVEYLGPLGAGGTPGGSAVDPLLDAVFLRIVEKESLETITHNPMEIAAAAVRLVAALRGSSSGLVAALRRAP